MVEVVGNLLGRYLARETAETVSTSQAVSLCTILEERFHDVSSYVRARVLKVLTYLCEYVLSYFISCNSKYFNRGLISCL
jgi:hypothetical protein